MWQRGRPREKESLSRGRQRVLREVMGREKSEEGKR